MDSLKLLFPVGIALNLCQKDLEVPGTMVEYSELVQPELGEGHIFVLLLGALP